jgi:RimJ/RimL family protein N-acetyltransferase
MGKLVLRGEFIDLLPLAEEHAALTFAWRNSERAMHLNRGVSDIAQQAQWIAGRPSEEHNFVVALKDGRLVGTVSLCSIDTQHQHGESGRFLIGDEDAVRGIPVAVEAMKMLYELAFDGLKLRRVFGSIASDNKLMMKWQKFLGMKEEGRLRSHYFIGGHFQDAVMFGILEEEFRRIALPRMQSLITAGRNAASSKK